MADIMNRYKMRVTSFSPVEINLPALCKGAGISQWLSWCNLAGISEWVQPVCPLITDEEDNLHPDRKLMMDEVITIRKESNTVSSNYLVVEASSQKHPSK